LKYLTRLLRRNKVSRKVFYLYQGDNLAITVDGETFTVNATTNRNFDEIVEALENEDYDTVIELANPGRAIQTYYSQSGDSELEIFGNKVTINGRALNPAMESRLLDMHEARLPLKPLVSFLEKVKENPSYSARQELFLFLDGNELPLTQDGNFMAYKSVNRWNPGSSITEDDEGRPFAEGDFMSIGTSNVNGLPTRYRLGDEPRRDRGEVDDDRRNTCSNGLHFASLGYASSWTGHDAVLLLQINPADVVSIPQDYGNQKGRACAFTVHSVHYENENRYATEKPTEAFSGPVYNTADNERWVVRGSDDKVADILDGTSPTSFTSREKARDCIKDFVSNGHDRSDFFIWDRVNKERVS
jgi:hypothetical protein